MATLRVRRAKKKRNRSAQNALEKFLLDALHLSLFGHGPRSLWLDVLMGTRSCGKILFLASSGKMLPRPEFRHALELFLRSWFSPTTAQTVQVLLFMDAKPARQEQPIARTTCDLVNELGYSCCISRYNLFDKSLLSVEKVIELRQALTAPGNICIFTGGNTWRLASAWGQLPSYLELKNLLVEHVLRGSLMYVGYSAGSIFAGPSVELCVDSQEEVLRANGKIFKNGLNLTESALRPHADKNLQCGAGKEFERKVALQEITDDEGSVLDCKVIFLNDGEACLMIGVRCFNLPAQSEAFSKIRKLSECKPKEPEILPPGVWTDLTPFIIRASSEWSSWYSVDNLKENNRWSWASRRSGSEEHWIKIDAHEIIQVDGFRVKVCRGWEWSACRTYKVQYSNDGVSWRTAITGEFEQQCISLESTAYHATRFPAIVRSQYWRLIMKSWSGDWLSIQHMQLALREQAKKRLVLRGSVAEAPRTRLELVHMIVSQNHPGEAGIEEVVKTATQSVRS